MTDLTAVALAVGALGCVLVLSAVRVVPDYQRVVVIRRGRVVGVRGPGPICVLPVLDRRRTVDLRVDVMAIPPQRGLTRDRIPVEASAVVQCHVVSPELAVAGVSDYRSAVVVIAQMMLAKAIGQFDAYLWRTERETIVACLTAAIRRYATEHGLNVTRVELLDVRVPMPLASQWLYSA